MTEADLEWWEMFKAKHWMEIHKVIITEQNIQTMIMELRDKLEEERNYKCRFCDKTKTPMWEITHNHFICDDCMRLVIDKWKNQTRYGSKSE